MRLLGTVIALLATAPGCAQIFGLDETSATPEPPVVSFTLQRFAVGSQVVIEPMDLSTGAARYLISDPAEPGGFRKVFPKLIPPNQWQAEIPVGTATQLQFTLADDAIVRNFSLPQRSISALYSYLGKPAAEAAPPAATFTFDVTLNRPYVAGDGLQWYSVGTWTQRVFAGAEVPVVGATALRPAAPIAYASATRLNGRLERHRATDDLLVLRYTGNQLNGQLIAAPFDQIDGANPITGAMTAVALDQSLSVSLDSSEPVSRLANAQPAFGAPSMAWSVNAAPGARAGINTGPTLNAVGITPNTGLVPVVASYGNPFAARAWPSTLTWTAATTRVYTPVGLPPITLNARLVALTPPPTDNRTIGFTSCFPTSVAVQGATLITDGLTVTIDRSKPVTVSFVPDRLAADLYSITLFEIVNDAGTQTLVARFQSVHQQPGWSLPADLFEAGKLYTVRAACTLGGFPMLATGDLETRALPLATAFMDSGVFTVAQ